MESLTVTKPNTLRQHQIALEKLYSKNQLLPRIRHEFMNCEGADFQGYIVGCGIPLEFGIDVLVQMALHKRATLPTLVGLLKYHFNNLQLTANMLDKCVNADLVDWDGQIKKFIVRYTMAPHVQEELDRFQFPLPMVVKPRLVADNRTTGYLMGTGSLIMKDNHHDEDICLDHINRMNRVKLTLNHTVARMIANKWRNLDKCKPGESSAEFLARKKAFEKYDRTAKDVMKILQQECDHFYLTHKVDKRGRTYPVGYHCNYQGTPWNKAVIEFHNKEVTV